jgi:hypothetical protein
MRGLVAVMAVTWLGLVGSAMCFGRQAEDVAVGMWVGLLAVVVIYAFVWWRCPRCGEQFGKALGVVRCPQCQVTLESPRNDLSRPAV